MDTRKTDTICSHLSLLLPELGCRVLSFLSSPDAVSFSENFPDYGFTLSCAGRDRCLFRFENWQGHYETGDQPLRSIYRIPVLTGITHSIRVTFSWKDQGWGNQKGQASIVATLKKPTSIALSTALSSSIPTDASIDPSPFRGGRVVCMTELAPQRWTEREMFFLPRDNEVYYLWHKAGGGGGHELLIQNFCLSTYIFDDAECNRSRMYERLLELGIVGHTSTVPERRNNNHAPLVQIGVVVNGQQQSVQMRGPDGNSTPSSTFYPKMLLRVCTSLLRQLQSIEKEGSTIRFVAAATTGSNETRLDPDLIEFMKEYEIPVTIPSLRALHDVVSANVKDCNFDTPLTTSQDRAFGTTTDPLPINNNNAARNGAEGPVRFRFLFNAPEGGVRAHRGTAVNHVDEGG